MSLKIKLYNRAKLWTRNKKEKIRLENIYNNNSTDTTSLSSIKAVRTIAFK